MTPFDPAQFRQQFPALRESTCYLDSAATALKPDVVIEAQSDYYRHNGATVHRSAHPAARRATELYEQARTRVAEFIGAPKAENVVWTKSATESINLVAQGYARPRLRAGDEIIVTEAEHHANLIPWLMVASQTGARVVKLPLDERYMPDLARLPALLNERTRILAISQMSNVTGGCPDLERAVSLAHANDTLVVVDGAQGVVHSPLGVQALNIDFYAFSAHKLYGPTGIGVLYGKEALLAEMAPWQGGGKMLTHADFNGFIPQGVPERFEAGTPNVAGVIGAGAALAWLGEQNIKEAERYTRSLAQSAFERLSAIPGFIRYSVPDSSLLSFNIAGFHHADLATLLSEQGFAVRAGQHCAQPLLDAIGTSGAVRASFAPYNSPEDVERLYQALRYAIDILE